MSYYTPSETGSETVGELPARQNINKLTASQGARSTLYEVTHLPTGKNARWQKMDRVKSTLSRVLPQRTKNKIAEREHIGRLLRDCQIKSASLLETTDPIDSALIGTNLLNNFRELWGYRQAREDDWVEILNVLQIVLTGQDFETFPKEKRLALVNIFQEGLLARTISRKEIDRTLSLLSDAGFDIWRGIQEQAEESK
jgi:hypothetical protein